MVNKIRSIDWEAVYYIAVPVLMTLAVMYFFTANNHLPEPRFHQSAFQVVTNYSNAVVISFAVLITSLATSLILAHTAYVLVWCISQLISDCFPKKEY